MPRNWSKAVPEGNAPIPHQDELVSRKPTMADFCRMIEELFDESNRKLDELTEMRATKQRLAGLGQNARQPRLAMEAAVTADKKTRKRTESAAAADRTKHIGDSSFAQADPNPMCLISSGDESTEPPALSSTRDDALVDNGAAVPKLCPSSVEMRTRTAAGGLLPAGTASTAMRDIFPRPLFSWSLGKEKTTSHANNQLAPICRWRVMQTKSRQILVFDPGSSKSRLRACPFLGTRRALVFGKVSFGRWMVPEAGMYKRFVRIAVDRCFPPKLG